MMRAFLLVAVLLTGSAGAALVIGADGSVTSAAVPANLHVQANKIVDSLGTTVQIRGVNRAGTEYACIQGWGLFDGPNTQASIDAMKTWGVNAVRVPLNEDCWLAINGSPAAYSGLNYQNAIKSYVDLLNQNGMYVLVELHWTAPGTA